MVEVCMFLGVMSLIMVFGLLPNNIKAPHKDVQQAWNEHLKPGHWKNDKVQVAFIPKDTYRLEREKNGYVVWRDRHSLEQLDDIEEIY